MKLTHMAAAAVAAGLAVAAVARADDTRGWTPEMTFKVKRVGPARVSPDGGRAAFVVGTAAMDGEKSEWVWQIHVGRPDGDGAFQLTRSEKSSTAPAWSPDGQWIAFVSARGGKDATANLWRIRVDGGEAEPLTEEKGAVSAPAWSPDGKWIAFLMTDPKSEDEEKGDKERRDARVVDEKSKMSRLYVVPAEADAAGKRAVRKLTAGALHVTGGFDWSPDSRTIAFTHQPTPGADDWTRSDVSVVDVAREAVRPLATSPAAESQPSYSPDGRWIALAVSDAPPTWSGRTRVHVVAAEGGAPRALALTANEEPEIVGWLADGRRILILEARGTTRRLSALGVDGSAPVDLTPADTMVEGASLNASGRRVAPERRMSSPVITKIAAGASESRSLCFDTEVIWMLPSSSMLRSARSATRMSCAPTPAEARKRTLKTSTRRQRTLVSIEQVLEISVRTTLLAPPCCYDDSSLSRRPGGVHRGIPTHRVGETR